MLNCRKHILKKSTYYRHLRECAKDTGSEMRSSIPSAPAIQILQHKKCCNKPIRNSHSIISALRMNKASGITSRRFYFSLNKKSPTSNESGRKFLHHLNKCAWIIFFDFCQICLSIFPGTKSPDLHIEQFYVVLAV